jgi:hypothetical protein
MGTFAETVHSVCRLPFAQCGEETSVFLYFICALVPLVFCSKKTTEFCRFFFRSVIILNLRCIVEEDRTKGTTALVY